MKLKRLIASHFANYARGVGGQPAHQPGPHPAAAVGGVPARGDRRGGPRASTATSTRARSACSASPRRRASASTTPSAGPRSARTRSPCSVATVLDVLTEIDHVAIAVNDLEAAIDYYRRAFGAEVEHREIVEQRRRRGGAAQGRRQLRPAAHARPAPDSPVAKALEKRGEGLHHVGYRVDDCAAALAADGGRRRHADRPGAAPRQPRARRSPSSTRRAASARSSSSSRSDGPFYLDTLTGLVADGVVAPTDRLLGRLRRSRRPRHAARRRLHRRGDHQPRRADGRQRVRARTSGAARTPKR